MRHLILAGLVLALSACASTPDANYSAYIEANARAQQQQAAQLASLADASHCTDDRCVESTKAFAALAMVAAGGGGRSQVAPPPRKVHWSEAFANVSSSLHPFGQIWGMVEGGKNNVEIARIGAERDARRDEAWAGMAVGIADAFGAQEPTYSYQIGGDYVPGQIGDNAGRDIVRDGSQVGHNTGAINTGTQIDNAGNYGDGNRQDSPDDNSTTCAGPGCQGVNRPITNPLPESDDEP